MPRTGAIEYAEQITPTHVLIRTTPCIVCRKQHEYTLNNEKYVRWQYGEHIQNVFTELSVADREILISGTCDDCFNEMFK